MEKNRKIWRIVIVIICLLIIILFYLSHKTCWKYNDWWIKGRNIEEVQKRYGVAKKVSDHKFLYDIGVDNSWIMPSHSMECYWIVVDDAGVVVKVYRGLRPGG